MKVKVLEIQIYSHEEAEKLERALQGWLNDNPNAKIEHVVQTTLAHGPVVVTIFYRD